MITSFHEDMYGTVLYDGSSSKAFSIRNGVKQGYVLASTLFGKFYLWEAVQHSPTDLDQEMLFVDDAELI